MHTTSLFVAGAAASVGLHFLFFGVVAPSLMPSSYAACQPQAVYVGAVLTPRDLDALGIPGRGMDAEIRGLAVSEASARGLRSKEPQTSFKPLPVVTSWTGTAGDGPRTRVRRPFGTADAARLSFYLFAPPDVLRNVDFSDLRKMVEREDVMGQMEVVVTVGPDGCVRAVRRIVGSGHPILDSFILFKLQRAVFGGDLLSTERFVRLHIRLK